MKKHPKKGQTRLKVYQYVQKQLLQGQHPTVREVQKAMGFKAVQTAQEHLQNLVDQGKLQKHPHKSRSYHLPQNQHTQTALIPLLGQIPAGPLSEAIQHTQTHIPYQTQHPEKHFSLKVQGESMTGAGILPGDIVIVRAQPTAQHGDIVVAQIEDQATIKTLHLKNNQIQLHPQNPNYKPIIPKPGTCTILGKVIEVRRHLEPQTHLEFEPENFQP